MKITVMGASGQIGSKVVALLKAAGHETVAASRDSGADVLTGAGLTEALAGSDVLVDVVNSPDFADGPVLDFFTKSATNLTAAAKATGVGNYVALSIVGCDGLPDSGYMRAKVAQERIITESGLPYTIGRATQFHEFAEAITASLTVDGEVRVWHSKLSYSQSLCPPYTGYFQDSSTNAITWLWDFGDGTTSTLQNPNHVYADPGVYNISLTITTADGCSVTCVQNYALNFLPLIANATAYTNDTVLPFHVDFFANTTGATSWFWDFGDSTTSTLENPSHTYTTPGPYTITLTIANDSCTYTYNYPPTAIGVGTGNLCNTTDSIHAPLPYTGCAPLPVNFHSPFKDAVSWSWDFGDGSFSTSSDPIHVYSQPGTYDVLLVVTTPMAPWIH